MSIIIDVEALTELPDVAVVEPPVGVFIEPPENALLVGPPPVDFVHPPDLEGSILVVVGGSGGGSGSGERVEFTVIAGFDVQAFRIVVPRVQEPNVRQAETTYLPHANRPLWLALHAALAGESLRVVSVGKVVNSGWNWIMAPIYVTDSGQLTQTPPEYPEALWTAQIGYPVDPDSLFIQQSSAVTLA